MIFLPETPRNAETKLDWFGFGTLSIALGALQIMLDRGEQLDWFGSGEIIIEAIVAASAFYLFLVHTFTAEKPFVRPSMFRDRNFAAGMLFIAIVGLTYYASMALAAALSAGADELSRRHRRPRHGAARRRHHGVDADRRPAGRARRYALSCWSSGFS